MQDIANERSLAPYFGERADLVAEPRRGEQPLQPAHVARALDRVGGLGWAVLGFVLGAVFWHFIGFWAFLSSVVLAGGPQHLVQPTRSAPAAERRQWLEVADASSPACTQLFRDNRTGLTTSRSCDDDHSALPADTFQGREDRMISGHAADASRGTLSASDRAVLP